MSLIKEFKPTISFLVRFLALYLVLNLLYGLFIDHYSPAPDPVTRRVSDQSAAILRLFGTDASSSDSNTNPYIGVFKGDQVILSVYEGCNGLNVAIIFVAFLLSFGKPSRKLLWFIPLGLLIIHLTNLLRVVLLFAVSVHLPGFMYFAHKYLFTGIIYVIVFVLWYIWIDKIYKTNVEGQDSDTREQ